MMRKAMLYLSIWHNRAIGRSDVKSVEQIVHWASEVGKSAHALRR